MSSSCWRHRVQLLCLKVTARYLGSDCGLKLGRQDAWRPGTIGMVSSSLLAALCTQLLCLKVTARYLGSGCGLKLGRQAAWRPGTIGMVSSSWLAAPCRLLLCLKVTTRYLGSDCGLKLGRQAAWRPGCNRNGVVSVAPAADQWMRVTSGTVLCGEEPQRRTAREIVFRGSIRSKSRAKSTRWKVSVVVPVLAV